MSQLEQTFAALSDPTRLAVVRLLRQAPRPSGELAAELDTSRPAMSRHLKVLREAGVVLEEISADDARVRVYALQPEPFEALRSFVDEVEAFWSDQLASFKRHAERRTRR